MKVIVKSPYFDTELHNIGDEVEVKELDPILHEEAPAEEKPVKKAAPKTTKK